MDFFMFTIFEISWFLSARGSVLQVHVKINFLKFIHQFYQFENEYLPEYFKKCVHLYFRGEIKLAHVRLTQSVQRSLGTQHYQQFISKERAWPLNWRVDLGKPVRFFENNSEIHDICWGIMNTYFLILWILQSGFGWNWCQNWRFILSTMCANDRNFRVSTRLLRSFLVLFVTTFEQKHCFQQVYFEAVITIFWTIWTIYYAT